MKARRKRSDPQATRYRVAVTALAKAEKRHAAAERAVADLRRKVKAYERRLPPERLAAIAKGTVERKEYARMRKERWRDAERTLRATARISDMPEIVEVLFLGSSAPWKKPRRCGMAVKLRDGQCLVWDFRDGFKTGAWMDRNDRRALRPPSQPIEFLEAAE